MCISSQPLEKYFVITKLWMVRVLLHSKSELPSWYWMQRISWGGRRKRSPGREVVGGGLGDCDFSLSVSPVCWGSVHAYIWKKRISGPNSSKVHYIASFQMPSALVRQRLTLCPDTSMVDPRSQSTAHLRAGPACHTPMSRVLRSHIWQQETKRF